MVTQREVTGLFVGGGGGVLSLRKLCDASRRSDVVVHGELT
jgi:hypothetical protein